MHLLADENFPKPIVEARRAEGHEVLWARMDHAGARDVVLLHLAEAEARIVLTLDKDFWQIAVQSAACCPDAIPNRTSPAFLKITQQWALASVRY